MEFCHSFIASIEMILWGFFSPFILLLTYHIDQFLSVDSFSNSRNKSHLVIVYNTFNVLLWFAHILFRISMSIFVKDICNFLVVSLPVFSISVKVFKIYSGCKNKQTKIPILVSLICLATGCQSRSSYRRGLARQG